MKELHEKPLVSIIVPVYNTGKFLYRCMDSLVYQSLKNIEIIAINNESTDNSLEILKKYEHDFPEKVKVITIPHAERAGTGRNVGMKYARSEYIVFSDSDDMMHPRAVEWLYEEVIKGNYDLVYAPFFSIKDGIISVKRKRQYGILRITNEQALRDAEPSPWGKIFRKVLLIEAGGFPENVSFEDLAFFYCYIGLAKKIGYCNKPVYYYFWRTDSEVHTLVNSRIAETVDAERYGLENCTPAVKQELVFNIANRILSNMSARWIYADSYLKHLNNLWPQISSNSLVYKNTKLFDRLAIYYRYSKVQTEKNLYINGFGEERIPDKYIEYLRKNSFYDSGAIIKILNEENCNIDILPSIRKAYDNKDYNYVAGYFALKNIYEQGGTYIGKNIILDLPLNFTRHLNAYFAYKGADTYNDQFFGGHSQQDVFKAIIDIYNIDIYSFGNTKLENYISEVLEFKYKIFTKARNNIYGNEISIFAPDVCSVPITSNTYDVTKLHFCHLTSITYFTDIENLQNFWMPQETFEWLYSNSTNKVIVSTKQNSRERIELAEIKASRSWKIIQKLKRKKDRGIWKVFYSIYLLICEKILRE